MNDKTKYALVKILKETGFESCSSRALELFLAIFEDRLSSMLRTLHSRQIHACRTSTTFLDLLDIVDLQDAFTVREDWKYRKKDSRALLTDKRTKLFRLPNIHFEEFPHEMQSSCEEWTSPVSIRLEKFIHIYEFMPPFPPVHTFRHTHLKPAVSGGLSFRVKNRLEQSHITEDNMIKLIKSSGSLPKFINYIYNRRA